MGKGEEELGSNRGFSSEGTFTELAKTLNKAEYKFQNINEMERFYLLFLNVANYHSTNGCLLFCFNRIC